MQNNPFVNKNYPLPVKFKADLPKSGIFPTQL